jgi:putative transposase
MNDNSNVFPLRQPGNIDDPLTDILRSGARWLLAQAIELEAETFLEARGLDASQSARVDAVNVLASPFVPPARAMKDLKLADGRDRVVRHGHGPERAIQTGIG